MLASNSMVTLQIKLRKINTVRFQFNPRNVVHTVVRIHGVRYHNVIKLGAANAV